MSLRVGWMSARPCVSSDLAGLLELVFSQCSYGSDGKRTKNTCVCLNLDSELVCHDFCWLKWATGPPESKGRPISSVIVLTGITILHYKSAWLWRSVKSFGPFVISCMHLSFPHDIAVTSISFCGAIVLICRKYWSIILMKKIVRQKGLFGHHNSSEEWKLP